MLHTEDASAILARVTMKIEIASTDIFKKQTQYIYPSTLVLLISKRVTKDTLTITGLFTERNYKILTWINGYRYVKI